MSEDRAEYNNDRDWENIEITVAVASDITIYIAGTGTENATTKYLNKESLGTGFVLRPDKNVQIVRINNKIYRNPISVSANGFSVMKHIPDIHTIVIRTTITTTNIKLLVT